MVSFELDSDSIPTDMQQPNTGHIKLLFGEIDFESSEDVCAWILNANFAPVKPEFLTLIINSHGGTLTDGFAITDIMASSAIPVRTIGIGQIQSTGLMIFMAGAKGHRVMSPNTSAMSHQYSTETVGKHNELVNIQKEFHLTHNRMIGHYVEHTGLSTKDVIKHLLPSADIFLSAEDALGFNICDTIDNRCLYL